jgi:xanthine dehydrogenase iron-sulfur cluster and FAD-binding subunit A
VKSYLDTFMLHAHALIFALLVCILHYLLAPCCLQCIVACCILWHMLKCAHATWPAAERIASFHGSQCGFCTPGIVVACHAALAKAAEAGEKPSLAMMQTGLDGNLCRCTGYRPILDACKVAKV